MYKLILAGSIPKASAVAASCLLAIVVSTTTQAASLDERIDQVIEKQGQELIEVRRDLHCHPELAGNEKRTATVIAQRLESLGLAVQTGVGGHGVVGILHGK